VVWYLGIALNEKVCALLTTQDLAHGFFLAYARSETHCLDHGFAKMVNLGWTLEALLIYFGKRAKGALGSP
jgi:hypothetical protein